MLNGLLKKSWWAQPTLRMLGATAYGVLRYMDDIRRVRCAGSADVPVRMRARRPRSRVQAVRNSPERHVACRARSYKWLTRKAYRVQGTLLQMAHHERLLLPD